MPIPFPGELLFGTATSATQIEGRCEGTDWLAFSREAGRVLHGDTPLIACDHWQRWREDVELQRSLGLHAHRLSVEWARVEPEEGVFDHAALERYREEVGALRDAGITPMVTLHHFTLPLWIARRGGLCARELPRLLERYAERVAEVLGDLVELWITLNEPNVVVVLGYLFGLWPPAERGRIDRVLLAHHRLLEAHVRMYRALHRVVPRRGRAPQVGVAHHLRVTEPHDPSRVLDWLAAGLQERFFNEGFLVALEQGRLSRPLDEVMAKLTGFSVREAKGTQDFFGLNYYSRDLVRLGLSREGVLERRVPEGADTTDLGWEIYPQGLSDLLLKWGHRLKLPVYITENGLADDDDDQRPGFLVRHLAEMARAMEGGVDVRGYFHWSLLDNFEWAEGYAPRFGLVEVDYETQQRRPRESAKLYARIAQERCIPDDVLLAHAPHARR